MSNVIVSVAATDQYRSQQQRRQNKVKSDWTPTEWWRPLPEDAGDEHDGDRDGVLPEAVQGGGGDPRLEQAASGAGSRGRCGGAAEGGARRPESPAGGDGGAESGQEGSGLGAEDGRQLVRDSQSEQVTHALSGCSRQDLVVVDKDLVVVGSMTWLL